MFIRAALLDGDVWHKVRDARGVSSVMGGGDPKALDFGIVDELMRIGVDGVLPLVKVDEFLRKYEAGTLLEVVGGSFAGHSGRCVLSSGNRIKLLLSLLGREVVVEVRNELVIKVSAQEENAPSSLIVLRPRRKRIRKPPDTQNEYDRIVTGGRS